jgi:hypothetical protein
MRIPMRGAVGSLNAAVAGSILLFEAVAQRDPDGRALRPSPVPWPTGRRQAEARDIEETAATGAAAMSPDEIGTDRDDAEAVVAVIPIVDVAAEDQPPSEGDAETAPAPVPPVKAGPRKGSPRKASPGKVSVTTPHAEMAPPTDDELLPGRPPTDALSPKRTRSTRKT